MACSQVTVHRALDVFVVEQQNFTKDSTIDRDLKLHPNYKQ